ncbi:hypothetical protein NGA_0167300, partial [Nannochloropsis gaditana CCMP526]
MDTQKKYQDLGTSSKNKSCQKCYDSKSKCDFSLPCER